MAIIILFISIGHYWNNYISISKYTSGKYTVEDTEMIVSRGLGNSIIPLRVFNSTEID